MHPNILFLLKATLLLGVGLIAFRLLALANPRWRMFVCQTTALAVLALPLVVLVPLDIPLVVKSEPPVSRTVSAPLASEGFAVPDAPALSDGAARAADRNHVGERAAAGRWLPTLSQTLVAVYFIGVLVLLVRLVVSGVRGRREVDALPEVGGAAADQLHALAAQAGLQRAPRLKLAAGATSPFCTGGRRPAIVVPGSLTTACRADALEFVLRHELHHIANRDIGRTMLLDTTAIALWFHPFAWMLRRGHLLATEELGDRAAAPGRERRARYRSLLASLALELDGERPRPAMALGLVRTPEIVVRLRRLALDLPHAEIAGRRKFALTAAVTLPALLALAGVEFVAAHAALGRVAEERAALIERLAPEERGAATTSIGRALDKLVDSQREDGGVSGKVEAGAGTGNLTGTTALAGMAFLAHGASAEGSPYHQPMHRCIGLVLAAQKGDGQFAGDPATGGGGSLYNHTTATTFLAAALPELHGARATNVRAALERALALLLRAQAVAKSPASQGGWRYTPTAVDSDLSCTIWAVRALYAMKAAGIEVPEKAIGDAIAYIERCQLEDGGFSYTIGGPLSSPSLNAGALYCLHKAGKGDTEAAKKARAALLKGLEKPGKHYEFYALMWAAAALAETGDDDGENAATLRRIVSHCRGRQSESGGWPSAYGENAGAAFVGMAYGRPL